MTPAELRAAQADAGAALRQVDQRETLEEKARRYLTDGRLTVLEVYPGWVLATCQGRQVYRVGYRRGGWYCTCVAASHHRRCAHLEALQLVTDRPTRQHGGDP